MSLKNSIFAEVMTKQFYIVVWILLGFFANPAISLACGTSSQKVEMACCSTKSSDEMDCCTKALDHHDESSNCGDSCSSASCQCPTVSMTTYLFVSNEWNTLIPTSNSNSYFYKDALTSTGFTLIWLPPKVA